MATKDAIYGHSVEDFIEAFEEEWGFVKARLLEEDSALTEQE